MLSLVITAVYLSWTPYLANKTVRIRRDNLKSKNVHNPLPLGPHMERVGLLEVDVSLVLHMPSKEKVA